MLGHVEMLKDLITMNRNYDSSKKINQLEIQAVNETGGENDSYYIIMWTEAVMGCSY